MFDEMKIMITGDASGIASAVKKAVSVVQGGVKDMNKQEVDWTGIFSRAVSPAIISGVASVFAYAISEAVQFQTALGVAGTAAGETSGQIATTSKAALGLSATVPQSAEDIANAMLQVSQIFGYNTEATTSVSEALAQLASAGFGPLNEVTAAAIDIFKQFGVTTSSDAVNVLTSLMHGAEGARESIPELVQQFSSFSSTLPASFRTLDTFNNLISTFAGTVQTIGASATAKVFSDISTSAQNAAGPLEKLGISMSSIQKSLVTDGGVTALRLASEAMARFGTNTIVPQALGFSTSDIAGWQTIAKASGTIATNIITIKDNKQSIADAAKQAEVGTNALLIQWNRVKASFLDSSFWDAVSRAFVGVVSAGADAITGLNQGVDSFYDDMLRAFNSPDLKNAAANLVNAFGGPMEKGSTPASLLPSLGYQGTAAQQQALGNMNPNSVNKSPTIANTQNSMTFNLTLPQGSAMSSASPSDISRSLYNAFSGVGGF